MTYNSRGLVTNVANEWSGEAPLPTRKNFALMQSGSRPTASSTFAGGPGTYPVNAAFNGDRTGEYWGADNGGWNDGTNGSFPDSLQVEFSGGKKTIDEIVVVTLQNDYATAGEPDETTSATTYGIKDFEVEYWDGSAWADVPLDPQWCNYTDCCIVLW